MWKPQNYSSDRDFCESTDFFRVEYCQKEQTTPPPYFTSDLKFSELCLNWFILSSSGGHLSDSRKAALLKIGKEHALIFHESHPDKVFQQQRQNYESEEEEDFCVHPTPAQIKAAVRQYV